MEDMATDAPGPMGWGVDNEDRLAAEAGFVDTIAASDPQFLAGSPAREPINQEFLNKVKVAQQAVGTSSVGSGRLSAVAWAALSCVAPRFVCCSSRSCWGIQRRFSVRS